MGHKITPDKTPCKYPGDFIYLGQARDWPIAKITLACYADRMKSAAEIRLAIIEQMAEALLDLNDPGDWTKEEIADARDGAEEYATVILDLFKIEVVSVDADKFQLAGQLANVREFMDNYMTEPLVKGENS